MSLNYKSVLITGASSGIGREYALKASNFCDQMIIVGRNKVELVKTQEIVEKNNPNCTVTLSITDLCDKSERLNLIDLAKKRNVDLLICASGGGNFGLFEHSNWDDEKKVIELNVEAPTHLTRGFLDFMIPLSKNRKCGIIIVSSHASFMRVPHFSVYASCKAYLNHFLLTLKQELRPYNIELMVVLPGATESKFSERSGIPKKMLSTPAHPSVVVDKTYKYFGKKTYLIIVPFDQIIYLAHRFLPIVFTDWLISTMQKKLLTKAGYYPNNDKISPRKAG